jgi:hypothetical protein
MTLVPVIAKSNALSITLFFNSSHCLTGMSNDKRTSLKVFLPLFCLLAPFFFPSIFVVAV